MVSGAVPKYRPSRKILILDSGDAFTATRPIPLAFGDPKWTWPRLSVLGASCDVSRIDFGFSVSPTWSAGLAGRAFVGRLHRRFIG